MSARPFLLTFTVLASPVAMAESPVLSGYAQLDATVNAEQKMDLVLSTAAINLDNQLGRKLDYSLGARYKDHDILLHHAELGYQWNDRWRVASGFSPRPSANDEDPTDKTGRESIFDQLTKTEGQQVSLALTTKQLDTVAYVLRPTTTDTSPTPGISARWQPASWLQTTVDYLQNSHAIETLQEHPQAAILILDQSFTWHDLEASAGFWSKVDNMTENHALRIQLNAALSHGYHSNLIWEDAQSPVPSVPNHIIMATLHRDIYRQLALRGEWRQQHQEQHTTNAFYLGLRATF